MEKIYSFKIPLKVVMTIVFAIVAACFFTISGHYRIVWIILGIALFCFMVLFFFKYRIVITDQGIQQDLGMFGWRSECYWDEIVRISRFGNGYGYSYRIDCKGKRPLMFTDLLDSYVDVLRGVVERAPQAVVDDSITKLLQKKRHKEWLNISRQR